MGNDHAGFTIVTKQEIAEVHQMLRELPKRVADLLITPPARPAEG